MPSSCQSVYQCARLCRSIACYHYGLLTLTIWSQLCFTQKAYKMTRATLESGKIKESPSFARYKQTFMEICGLPGPGRAGPGRAGPGCMGLDLSSSGTNGIDWFPVMYPRGWSTCHFQNPFGFVLFLRRQCIKYMTAIRFRLTAHKPSCLISTMVLTASLSMPSTEEAMTCIQ